MCYRRFSRAFSSIAFCRSALKSLPVTPSGKSRATSADALAVTIVLSAVGAILLVSSLLVLEPGKFVPYHASGVLDLKIYQQRRLGRAVKAEQPDRFFSTKAVNGTGVNAEESERTGGSDGARSTDSALVSADEWEVTYPKPRQSNDLLRLLNDHVSRHSGVCSGRRPLGAVVFYYELSDYGLADGLRGILLAYTLAVVTGRAFLIKSQDGFPADAYFDLANPSILLPNELGTIDWRMQNCTAVSDLMAKVKASKGKSASTSPAPKENSLLTSVMDLSMQNDPDCSIARALALNNSSLPPVILLHSNQDTHCALVVMNDYNKNNGLEELHTGRHEPVFRTLFRRLFSFRRNVVKTATKFLKESSVNLATSLCIHVRSGSFHVDKSDGFSPNVDINASVLCALDVEKLFKNGRQESEPRKHKRWVVVSDDTNAKERVLALTKLLPPWLQPIIVDTNGANVGPVAHMREVASLSTSQRKAAVNRMMFDFYMLSRCQFMLAYKSGYAGLAAMLGEDWSKKKVFATGRALNLFMPFPGNRTCRRYYPDSGQ